MRIEFCFVCRDRGHPGLSQPGLLCQTAAPTSRSPHAGFRRQIVYRAQIDRGHLMTKPVSRLSSVDKVVTVYVYSSEGEDVGAIGQG
jgi:hypothetical protein